MGNINRQATSAGTEHYKVLPPLWKIQKYQKRLARIFGRLQQNVSSDPTRKRTLLVIWRRNKINKCVREFEVIVLKGSYIAQHQSQQSSARDKRAEPSEAEQSGDAGNEIKNKADTQQLSLDIAQSISSLTVQS